MDFSRFAASVFVWFVGSAFLTSVFLFILSGRRGDNLLVPRVRRRGVLTGEGKFLVVSILAIALATSASLFCCHRAFAQDAGLDAGSAAAQANQAADKAMQFGSEAIGLADAGNWWGVAGLLLAFIPFGSAWLMKSLVGTRAWMHLWFVPVLWQAAISAGTAVAEAVNAGITPNQHTVSAAGAIFLKSIIAWTLLHRPPPSCAGVPSTPAT